MCRMCSGDNFEKAYGRDFSSHAYLMGGGPPCPEGDNGDLDVRAEGGCADAAEVAVRVDPPTSSEVVAAAAYNLRSDPEMFAFVLDSIRDQMEGEFSGCFLMEGRPFLFGRHAPCVPV